MEASLQTGCGITGLTYHDIIVMSVMCKFSMYNEDVWGSGGMAEFFTMALDDGDLSA
jgi:hypothetical protein